MYNEMLYTIIYNNVIHNIKYLSLKWTNSLKLLILKVKNPFVIIELALKKPLIVDWEYKSKAPKRVEPILLINKMLVT